MNLRRILLFFVLYVCSAFSKLGLKTNAVFFYDQSAVDLVKFYQVKTFRLQDEFGLSYCLAVLVLVDVPVRVEV